MRFFLLSTLLLLTSASAVHAQDSLSDVAVTYHWVRTNAGPGDCGCFGLNGGGLSGSWNLYGPWSVVVDLSSEHTGSGGPLGNSLTLTSLMAGARYQTPLRWMERTHQPRPFAQFLIGSTHAGGGVAGVADGSFEFSMRIGGGIDIPLNSRFAVRAVQTDYYLTTSANARNNHQNNFLVGAGILYYWSR